MIRRQTCRAVRFTVAFTHALLLFCATGSQAGTIMVDLGVEQGPMNHRANGYLVSIEPAEPSMELILPLKPTSFRGNAGYVFKNYDRLKQAGVTEFQLTLGLVFKDLPLQIFDINQIGEDGSYEPWLAHVDRIIDQVVDRQLSVLWDIYNEPDLATLPINDNERLKEGWRLAYQRIKHRIPGAQVVGPSVSRYRLLKPFLEWSHEHGVFPDVVAYHEYDDPSHASGLVDDLRNYLARRGLSRPISVNEILGQETWTIAGYTVGVIAAYERANILSAMRSCWPDPQDMSRDRVENTCDNPTLDGLLYVDRQSKRPGWHIYKSYAEMEGVRLYTMTDSPKLHALAAFEKASGTLQLLMGKYEEYSTADTTVILKNAKRVLPVDQGSSLHLCAEQIPDTGSGPLASTVVTLDRALPLAEEDVSFSLPQFYHSDAYRVVVSPVSGCQLHR
ncbi:MAG: Putative Glycoside hydrolase, family 5 [Nitrospira sp.]|nr:MAG: Putative Glycoside hydrolase, family 5 [Nitrospira sp.]